MKKYLSLTCFILCCNLSQAQYTTIPDSDFRNFLFAKYPNCFNAEMQMNINCTEITTEDSLEFHGINSSLGFPAMNIEGIQYFTSLVYLNCSSNKISFSPALPASLKYLDFSRTSTGPGDGFLPALPNGLQRLVCTNNFLTNISIPASLQYLNCSDNTIASIGILPGSLDTLICKNQLAYEPVTHVLHSLPALPSNLRYLDCSENGLNLLPALPTSLSYLNCNSQYINTSPETTQRTLSSLPPLPAGLLYLDCSNNFLSALPGLPTALKYLDCSAQYIYINTFPPPPDPYNYTLFSLPALPASLKFLYCSLNMITCLPHLPVLMDTLVYDTDKIACIPNSCSAVPYAPVCNPANDYNQCSPFPVIEGNIFTDNNSNGIKDANEYPRRNIKVSLSNGAYTFSDNSGHFTLAADSIGLFTVSITAPAYYNSIPSASSFVFNSYDTLVTTKFALQPLGVKDSVAVKIIPIYNAVTPGGAFPYLINYENRGTTFLSPSLSFKYDNTKLIYDSCSDASVLNSGSSLELPFTNLAPGQSKSFTGYFRVVPLINSGDSVKSSLMITAGSAIGIDSNISITKTSLDPNDKQATEQLTPLQMASGKYIDYEIHFQNTGFNTAAAVVISDTLSSYLLINSLELKNASHNCRLTKKGNIVYFECRNILLPASNVDEGKSHGFVQFSVKPLPGIALNTIIENKAAVYFDYNIPAITNTAITVIKAPGRVYTFNGNGNWNDASNWKNNIVPPASIQQNEVVIISPQQDAECILNVPVTVLPGAEFSVQTGKKLVIQGNLNIQ